MILKDNCHSLLNLSFLEKDLCIHSSLVIRGQLLSIPQTLVVTGYFLLIEVFKSHLIWTKVVSNVYYIKILKTEHLLLLKCKSLQFTAIQN